MMILEITARTGLAVLAVILLVRLNGLRSFSKMSSFDFALTVAVGSLLAGVISGGDSPWPALVGIVAVFAARFAISKGRVLSDAFEGAVDNSPMFLMYEGRILEENLPFARVTRSDLISKLREANALDIAQVRAVVLEATGDISVLHGGDVSPELLDGVSWGRAKRRATAWSGNEGAGHRIGPS